MLSFKQSEEALLGDDSDGCTLVMQPVREAL